MTRSHFAGDASEQGDIQKGTFSKAWCKESRLEEVYYHRHRDIEIEDLFSVEYT